MAQYKTQQKRELLDFMSAHSGKAFSAAELAEALAAVYPNSPGRSTVYRLINRLCTDGTVKRFVRDGSKQFLYQLAGGEECHRHLHLKCTQCGKLLHMDDAQSENILSAVYGDCEFSVSREQTTLFGCCADCRRSQKSSSEEH